MAEEWHKTETYKSMIAISMEGFKYLALLNGGAAAGMLTTFDRLANVISLVGLKTAIFWFVAGLILDGVAVFSSYVTQYALYNEDYGDWEKGRHSVPLAIAFLCCAASLICFAAGALTAVCNVQ